MELLEGVKIFVFCFVIIIILDLIWVGLIMNKFYKKELGTLGRIENGSLKANIPATIGVYILLALGLVFFVFNPSSIVSLAALRGALLGLVIYGVYELTNYAVLNNWSSKIVIVDTVWGIVICSLTSIIVTIILRYV